jgi:hypothetical protein
MTGGPGAAVGERRKKALRGALAVSLGLSFPGRPSWAGSSLSFFVLLTFFIFCFHFCVV